MQVQEPYFFSRGGKNLFGIFYPPQGQPQQIGFVLCNGFGKEYILSLSFLTNFARQLAAKGYAVFRFDYLGYGDSEGKFTEATISSMKGDIESALDELKQRASLSRLGLLGLRFGGTLATLVAANRPDIEQLILWEPIPNGWDYIYGELRQTVTMQTMLFRDVRITREQIVSNILAGKPSISDGYNFNCIDEGFPLGADFIREVQQVDLLSLSLPPKTRTLLLNINKKEGAPVSKNLLRLAEAFKQNNIPYHLDTITESCLFWKQEPTYATHSPNLFNRTLTWLEEEKQQEQ
jgi:pimeloyl-ACP methyl ester carboxylesterase